MIVFAVALALSELAAAADSAVLVVTPVAVADPSGRRVDDSSLTKAAAALAKAAAARGVRVRAPMTTSVAVPVHVLPPDLAALSASARTAADELDTKNGVRLHRELIGKLTATLADHGDVAALVDTRLSLASLYLAMNEKALAKAELDAAARLRPVAELDLSRWSPQMAEAFAEAQGRVKSEPGGDVDIAVATAAIFVDGVRVGEAPLSIPLRRGIHLVEAVAPGHATLRRVVEVEPGGRARLDERMTADAAFELESKLRSELATTDRRVESTGLARSLGRVDKASEVIVTAVAPMDGGVAFIAARVIVADELGGEPRVVVASLDPGLAAAEATIAKALATLAEPAGAFTGGVSRVRGDNAPEPRIAIDPKTTLLGLARTAASVAASVAAAEPVNAVIAKPAKPAPPAASLPPPASDDGGFPWLWVGGGVAVVAIGAGVAAAILLQPTPEPVRGPDTTTLSVGVAP